jgi:5,10-methylenetetrahydromethanopterin reductase
MPTIGLVFPAHAPARELPAFAGRAEQLGYDSVWLIEDCFMSGSIAMAGAALECTERLRIGIGLMPVTLRSPALAAMEIATLANMYPGRITATFGHGVEGWMRQVDARPPDRVRALEETVDTVRRLLAGEAVSNDGQHVRFDRVALDFPPPTVPPVLIGTTGAKGVSVAERAADGLLFAEGCGPRFVRDILCRHPRSGHIALYAWLAIDDSFDAAAARVTPAIQSWLDRDLFPAAVRAAREATSGPGEADEALVREVSICGDRDGCVAAVHALTDAGADAILLAVPGSDLDAQVARFAAEVLPQFAGDAEPV